MRFSKRILCLVALLGASGCPSNTTTLGDAALPGVDEGPPPDGALATDGSAAIDQSTMGDLLGLDLCSPLAATIAHPDAGGCRTPAMSPVLFRGLVSASCVDVTNQNPTLVWNTIPASPLDGKTGNDQMVTLPLGTYTIQLKVAYMNQFTDTTMTFSIKSSCP